MFISCFLDLDGVSQSQEVEVVSCIMSDEKPNSHTDTLKVTLLLRYPSQAVKNKKTKSKITL